MAISNTEIWQMVGEPVEEFNVSTSRPRAYDGRDFIEDLVDQFTAPTNLKVEPRPEVEE